MCGLFGILSQDNLSPEDLRLARLARDLLAHRGPDNAGELVDSTLYLGHRRLSIIDTSQAGSQPMDAGNVAIRSTAKSTTSGNSGPISNASAASSVPNRISKSCFTASGNGVSTASRSGSMKYAAIIFDRATRQIYALRDRAGIKPLLLL